MRWYRNFSTSYWTVIGLFFYLFAVGYWVTCAFGAKCLVAALLSHLAVELFVTDRSVKIISYTYSWSCSKLKSKLQVDTFVRVDNFMPTLKYCCQRTVC